MEKTLSQHAPVLKQKFGIPQLHAEKHLLDNGIEVYFTGSSQNELIYTVLHLPYGRMAEEHPLQAVYAMRLIKNGTDKTDSNRMHAMLDQTGATVTTSAQLRKSEILIYHLHDKSEEVFGMVSELLDCANYDAAECAISIQRDKEEHHINCERVDFLAGQKFAEMMYGPKHPRGRSIEEADYDALNRTWFTEYHQRLIKNRMVRIVSSASYTPSFLQWLNTHFGQQKKNDADTVTMEYELTSYINKRAHVLKAGVQSAIAAGMYMYNEKDADEVKISLTNTLFGGFFGSRLMGNIRERNGYTYGIRSSITETDNRYYMEIRTECGNAYTDKVITEIENEMNRLQEEKVSDSELRKVKQYMNSAMLKYTDGPFATTDTAGRMLFKNYSFDYWKQFNEQLWQVTADEVLATAQKYFHFKNLTLVTAGAAE